MDMFRLGVLIWLFLPAPRRWYVAQSRKCPSTRSGRIVNILLYYSTRGEADLPGMNVTCAYGFAGTEYTGQGSLGGSRKPVKKIRVR